MAIWLYGGATPYEVCVLFLGLLSPRRRHFCDIQLLYCRVLYCTAVSGYTLMRLQYFRNTACTSTSFRFHSLALSRKHRASYSSKQQDDTTTGYSSVCCQNTAS